ncbi:MAG TPA: STAS domain-containing protein [Solirubrobacteraceae bacterium]|nr:STAS domain-containing protein [Solirubrobacteraceae bacterium]
MEATANSWRQQLAPFRVEVHNETDVARVVPVGELDIGTVRELEAQLRELHDADFHHVVLDLRQLRFIALTGVALIFAEHRLARTSGREFSLISGPPVIQRALQAFADELPFVDAPASDPRSPTGARAAPQHRISEAALSAAVRELRTQRHRPIFH